MKAFIVSFKYHGTGTKGKMVVEAASALEATETFQKRFPVWQVLEIERTDESPIKQGDVPCLVCGKMTDSTFCEDCSTSLVQGEPRLADVFGDIGAGIRTLWREVADIRRQLDTPKMYLNQELLGKIERALSKRISEVMKQRGVERTGSAD